MKFKFVYLFAFCLTLYLIHLNHLYVDIMEARNFVSAREMVQDGHWIFTTLNGEPRYQKPPLPTWLSAAMGEIFGTQTVWALRLPAALSCFALIMVFYQWLKNLTLNKDVSWISTAVLATSFMILYVGKRGEWDVFSYSFGLIGCYFFYLTFRGSKSNYFEFFCAGLFIGFSILSKGPTGIYVICAPFFLAYWLVYGFPKIKWSGWILMALVALVVGLSWYGYVYHFDQENFVKIIEDESTARTNREVKPFTRYMSFPVQMGIWAILALVSLIFQYVKKKTNYPKVYQFFFWWTIICLILLSLVPSKKERYLFPLMIPLSATTGILIYQLIQNQTSQKWEKILMQISFGLIGFLVMILPAILFIVLKIPINFYSIALTIFSFFIGIYILIQIFKYFNIKQSFFGILLFVSSAMIFGIPVMDGFLNNNDQYHSILTQKKKIEQSGLNVYGYNAYSPEIWFKYGVVIPEIKLNAPKFLPKESSFYLITINDEEKSEKLTELKNEGFELTFIQNFDDNEENPSSNNYVDRKKMSLYKVNTRQK